jgi:hypothetical protein
VGFPAGQVDFLTGIVGRGDVDLCYGEQEPDLRQCFYAYMLLSSVAALPRLPWKALAVSQLVTSPG